MPSKSSPDNSQELTLEVKDSIFHLRDDEDKILAQENLARVVINLKNTVKRADPIVNKNMSNSFIEQEMFTFFLKYIDIMDAETNEDLSLILITLIPHNVDVMSHEFCVLLLRGLHKQKNSQIHETILKECIKHKRLSSLLLWSLEFLELFKLVNDNDLVISNRASNIIRDVMLSKMEVTAQYLEAHFNSFCVNIKMLINHPNQEFQVNSLKLLDQILSHSKMFDLKVCFVSNLDNLKLVVRSLLSPVNAIQVAALSLLEAFIINPCKPQMIKDYLVEERVDIFAAIEEMKTDDDVSKNIIFKKMTKYS